MTGTVFRWNSAKGIGNIATKDGSVFFFHHSAVVNETGRVNFRLGERVTFEPVPTNKTGDTIAINISRIM